MILFILTRLLEIVIEGFNIMATSAKKIDSRTDKNSKNNEVVVEQAKGDRSMTDTIETKKSHFGDRSKQTADKESSNVTKAAAAEIDNITAFFPTR